MEGARDIVHLAYPALLRELTEDEGGGFVLEFPDLPGCVADGDTVEEAIANAQDAIAEWIDAAKALGRSVPEPQFG